MTIILIAISFLVCLAFSGYQCWKIGKTQGIQGTLSNLQHSGLIDLE